MVARDVTGSTTARHLCQGRVVERGSSAFASVLPRVRVITGAQLCNALRRAVPGEGKWPGRRPVTSRRRGTCVLAQVSGPLFRQSSALLSAARTICIPNPARIGERRRRDASGQDKATQCTRFRNSAIYKAIRMTHRLPSSGFICQLFSRRSSFRERGHLLSANGSRAFTPPAIFTNCDIDDSFKVTIDALLS